MQALLKAASIRTRGIARLKVHVARRIKEVTDPKRRDFLEGRYGKRHVNMAYNDHKKIYEVDEIMPFSKASEIDSTYPVMAIDRKLYNKEMKTAIKIKMDEEVQEAIVTELNNPKQLATPEALKVNKINAVEWDKFRRAFYEKNELSRLLTKRSKNQVEILDSGARYEGDSDFLAYLGDQLAMIKGEGTRRNQPKTHAVNVLPMNNYRAEVQHLKNDKIDGLLGLHQSNDKLKQLMECGFMDKSKSIKDVFGMLKGVKSLGNSTEGSSAPKSKNGATFQSPTNEAAIKDEGDSPNIDSRLQQLNEFSLLHEGNPMKMGAMDLVMRAVNDNGLQGSHNASYSDLIEFVAEYAQQPEAEKQELLERLDRIKSIRDFEEGLLATREDHMLEGRGRPTFSKLTPEERIAYVKHNVHFYHDLFELVKREEATVTKDLPLTVAVLEKLALGSSMKDMFYKNSQFADLQLVAQPQYTIILKTIKDNLKKLGFDELARVLYSVGVLHRREAGEIVGGLFQATAKEAIRVMDSQLSRYIDYLSKSSKEEQESKAPAMMYNFGIAIQGLLTLGIINSSTPEALIDKMLFVIQSNIEAIEEGCTANRVLSFLLQIGSKFGLAYEARVDSLLEVALNHFDNAGIVERMTRPDLVELQYIALALQAQQLPSQAAMAPLVYDMKDALLNPDHFKFLNLLDTSNLLMVLSCYNQLDVKTKNVIKKKFRDEMVNPPMLLTYVVPQTLENLAIADLRDSNKYYNEYTSPRELIMLRQIFGVRPFDYDNTPKFELYKDLHTFVAANGEKLNKREFLKLIDAICAIEVPLESFQYSVLEKTMEDFLEGDKQAGRQFDTKLAARVSVLYGMIGIGNLRDKWINKCVKEIMNGAPCSVDSTIDLLGSLELESVTSENEPAIRRLTLRALEKASMQSETIKIALIWNATRLEVLSDEEIISAVESLNPRKFKMLDKLLLCQIPQARELSASFSDEHIIEFFKFVMVRASNMLQNDTSSVYFKLVEALRKAGVPFKQEMLLRAKGVVLYLPLYIPGTREVTYILPENLFLSELEMSQRRDQGFNYKLVQGYRLPGFFNRIQDGFEEAGITCRMISLTEALQDMKEMTKVEAEVATKPSSQEELSTSAKLKWLKGANSDSVLLR